MNTNAKSAGCTGRADIRRKKAQEWLRNTRRAYKQGNLSKAELNAVLEHFPDFLPQSYEKIHAELVIVAETLARNNGGVLQAHGWLNKNGYARLSSAIKKHTELFAHIKQKAVLSRYEWIQTAELLSESNQGVLYSPGWLKRNGYHGLRACMHRHPEWFSHIPQEYKVKRPNEWVPVLEKLAKNNGGYRPTLRWLRDNGYPSMLTVLRNHSELFSHIPIKTKKTVEWVPILEKLAKNNGGARPTPSWLKANRYSALYHATQRRPDLFAHI